VDPPEHQTLVVHRTYEAFVATQRLPEQCDRIIYQFVFQLKIPFNFLAHLQRLELKRKAFSVVKLGIVLIQKYASIKVSMGKIELLLLQTGVAAIEVVFRVTFIQLYRRVVLLYAFIKRVSD